MYILYFGTHPDGEAWTFAAIGRWSELEGQCAGLITLTRGEGGAAGAEISGSLSFQLF